MWVFLFLPLFTFFSAGRHTVSTKPYLVHCCYFHVLPVGHFVSKECKENSGTEKWIAYHWVLPCLVFTQIASSGEVFNFGWRIISKCFLYFCSEFYIAYIFLEFRIATLFSIPHIQKLFVLALFNVLSCHGRKTVLQGPCIFYGCLVVWYGYIDCMYV